MKNFIENFITSLIITIIFAFIRPDTFIFSFQYFDIVDGYRLLLTFLFIIVITLFLIYFKRATRSPEDKKSGKYINNIKAALALLFVLLIATISSEYTSPSDFILSHYIAKEHQHDETTSYPKDTAIDGIYFVRKNAEQSGDTLYFYFTAKNKKNKTSIIDRLDRMTILDMHNAKYEIEKLSIGGGDDIKSSRLKEFTVPPGTMSTFVATFKIADTNEQKIIHSLKFDINIDDTRHIFSFRNIDVVQRD